MTPGSTGVPSMRWSSRNFCSAGSRVTVTTTPLCTLVATSPTIGPVARSPTTAAGSAPPAGAHSAAIMPSTPATMTSPEYAE